MNRLLYRLLLGLHPPHFRERFGDEMLCIFDESASRDMPELFVDGFTSLLRQWLLHSGVWKLGAGAVISSLLLSGWALAFTRSVTWSVYHGIGRRMALVGRQAPADQVRPVDMELFSREAAQAVAMLARFRRMEKRQHRRTDHSPKRSPLPTPPNVNSAVNG